MYYGWNNSVNITGWIGYTPKEFINKKGLPMIIFDVYVPRYSYKPKREGEITEALDPIIIKVIGGHGVVKAMRRKKLNKGDVVCVTGALITFKAEKKGVEYTYYYIDPNNVLALKGYRGMKAIEYTESREAIYNELLKELKLIDDNSDTTGNNS